MISGTNVCLCVFFKILSGIKSIWPSTDSQLSKLLRAIQSSVTLTVFLYCCEHMIFPVEDVQDQEKVYQRS